MAWRFQVIPNRFCVECGREFEPKPGAYRVLTCSQKCRSVRKLMLDSFARFVIRHEKRNTGGICDYA